MSMNGKPGKFDPKDIPTKEATFTLRGRDRLAAGLVRLWASRAEAHGCRPEKVAEARACADAMEQTPGRHWPD